MANLIRSAKSGSDWTLCDLESYRINIDQVDPLDFFSLQELPEPSVDQELLTNVNRCTMRNPRHGELIGLLNLAMVPEDGKTAVGDFAVELFKILGYTNADRLARTRVDLSLLICAENKHAKTDVCIVDSEEHHILLLVQEVKILNMAGPVDSQAKLVADAVAAFNKNNAIRKSHRLPPLEEKIMPGILMVGTLPAFYQIPVTSALSAHIRHGTYPEEDTRVIYCYPPVPRPASRREEGMKPLDNRREILKCYEAFKKIVGI